jgi:hypothetical protein
MEGKVDRSLDVTSGGGGTPARTPARTPDGTLDGILEVELKEGIIEDKLNDIII